MNSSMPIERWDIDLEESTSDRKIQMMQRKYEVQKRVVRNYCQ